MALEEMENENAVPATPEVVEAAQAQIETEVAQNECETAEIECEVAEVQEAAEIGEAVADMAEGVREDLAAGKPMTEQTASVVETAMEHFRARLGYKKAVMPAMEEFEGEDVAKATAGTEEALKNMDELGERLDATLEVAQEGLVSRVKNAWDRMTTSNEKIAKEVKVLASAKMAEEHDIKDPAYGRVFARAGKTEITGNDVAEYLKALAEGRKKMTPILKELVTVFDKASSALSKGRFLADDEGTKELYALIEKARAIEEEHDKHFSQDKGTEKSVNMKSASAADAKKIAKLVEDMADDAEYDKVVEKFEDALGEMHGEEFNASVSRLAGNLAADARAFRRLMSTGVQKVYHSAYEIGSTEQKAIFSAYKYLKMSAAK